MERSTHQLRILKGILALLERKQRPMWNTKELARSLEKTHTHFHKHYPSRRAVLIDLADWVEEELIDLAVEGLTYGERSHAGLRWLRAALARNPGVARVMTGEAFLREDPKVQDRAAAMWARIENALAAQVPPSTARRAIDTLRGELIRASEANNFAALLPPVITD